MTIMPTVEDLLSTPLKVITLDTRELTQRFISENGEDILDQKPAGLFIPNEEKPLVSPNDKLFIVPVSDKASKVEMIDSETPVMDKYHVPVENYLEILDMKGGHSIMNEKQDVVVPGRLLISNLPEFLRIQTTPYDHYYAFLLTRSMVARELLEFRPEGYPHLYLAPPVKSHLKDEFKHMEYTVFLDDLFIELIHKVEAIRYEYPFNMVDLRFTNDSIKIEILCDFRIHDYHVRLEEKEKADE